jgi:biotin carboxyl carrier protein
MKVNVRIGSHTYEVEVGDLYARPVIATVAGEQYEVWPEEGTAELLPLPPAPVARPAENGAVQRIVAPLPGVIRSVAVAAGADVTVGQELCVLEAMKMNNVVRSPRGGKIAAVHASVGQHVQHHDLLFEFMP